MSIRPNLKTIIEEKREDWFTSYILTIYASLGAEPFPD